MLTGKLSRVHDITSAEPLIGTKAFSPEELLCSAAGIYGCIRDLAAQDGAFITAAAGEKREKV